jgi:phospholipase/lecithinase/hemolysin
MIYDIFVRLKRAFVPLLAFAVTFSVSSDALAESGGLPGRPGSGSPFSAIYVIGDSMSDTGRTAAVLPGYPQYPFPLWIQYFAPMVRQAYNPLDNFAWAGAMTGFTGIVNNPPDPPVKAVNNVYGELPGMTNEVLELKSLLNSALDPKALYVVFGGTNDFLRITKPEDADSVIRNGVSNLFSLVVALHDSGARNIVVVNVPDLGRVPLNLSRGPAYAQLATQFSAQFNHDLDAKLNTVAIDTCRVNLFDLSRELTDKPKKYGFTNITDQSFPDLAKSDTYLFWDQVHPTTRGHRLIAEEIFQAVSKAGMLKPNPR